MKAETLGKQIVTLLKEKGLTQKELAAMLHVTDKAVSKWERGLNFPELTLLEPLATALGTTVIQLLSLENVSNREVAETLSNVALKEKNNLIRELRIRSWIKLFIELILLVALIYASKLFADHNIYGMAQVCTMGMMGFVGTLMGTELHLLRSLLRLR